ncbi:AAA family ATPase [Larkinella sp. VNQ87]|uniref:AAA family ATPase n=1 Tax=Larkinella sp. VNQ87 TaxID=3400921 RepID=UPI003BFE15EA
MEKLIVRNCGPIKEATVDVRKNTVFIGPQGSGKSTLAKLIALCTDISVFPIAGFPSNLFINYNLESYVNLNTYFHYETPLYFVEYKKNLSFGLTDQGLLLNKKLVDQRRNNDLNYKENGAPWDFTTFVHSLSQKLKEKSNSGGNWFSISQSFHQAFFQEYVLRSPSTYIPSERNLTAMLSSAIWSLLYSDINIPKPLVQFGRTFEAARNQINKLSIPFLGVRYSYENGKDRILYGADGSIDLANSASGYQSIIPLLLVVDYLRSKESRRFVIEEPELNLFPQAQKELMYYLLNQSLGKYQSQTVITTHSPYILSAINNLLFAYKVAESSAEDRAKIEEIIPAGSWLDPAEFSAYFVENGTIRSIMNETTGLIGDNELDDVSEDIAGERDQLLTIYRNSQRERTA